MRARLLVNTLVAAAVLGLPACDDDSPTAPPPPASLAAQGELGLSCGLDCSYEAEAVNSGAGCATDVRGITRLLDSSGGEIASDDWSLDPARIIDTGESFLYEGCCFSLEETGRMSGYETEIFWDDIACR